MDRCIARKKGRMVERKEQKESRKEGREKKRKKQKTMIIESEKVNFIKKKNLKIRKNNLLCKRVSFQSKFNYY